ARARFAKPALISNPLGPKPLWLVRRNRIPSDIRPESPSGRWARHSGSAMPPADHTKESFDIRVRRLVPIAIEVRPAVRAAVPRQAREERLDVLIRARRPITIEVRRAADQARPASDVQHKRPPVVRVGARAPNDDRPIGAHSAHRYRPPLRQVHSTR